MAIRFVDSTASGANDGTSWTDAFTSLNTALTAANHTPGDQYLVSGTFNEIVTIAEIAAAGNPTIIQGDDKSGGAGVGNPATFTIDGQSTRANCLVDSLGNVDAFYVIKNMRCTGATGDGQITSLDFMTYKDCRWDNNGADGCTTTQPNNLFERCEFDNNGTNGLGVAGGHLIAFCSIHDNGGRGVLATAAGVSFYSVFYGNTGPNYEASVANSVMFLNCTFDGDGKTNESIRLDHASLDSYVMLNCIVANTDGVGGVGLSCTSVDIGETAVCSYNCFYNNDTDYENAATFFGEVLTDPGFTNPATDDYTLTGAGDADGAGGDGANAPIT